jgi:hypothetical protein
MMKILFGLVGLILTGLFIYTVVFGVIPIWIIFMDIIGLTYLFVLFKMVSQRKLIYVAVAIVLAMSYHLYNSYLGGNLIVGEMKELYMNSRLYKIAYIVYYCHAPIIVWGSLAAILLTTGVKSDYKNKDEKPFSE